ncbi:flagellar biosynthesis regulator FlaF [Magnetospirillum sp. UT-4]|uniref:flagellar biosynthesis regulator FlaF n=1 Tax=Magnetospirillum sp. UT-4 TaxID=2681467 RepID=UPI0015731F65|nr:flagellar biosynthesis regulator FlaF [Magnetospirillum sp. UT-4]
MKNYAQAPERQDARMIEAWGLTQAALQMKTAVEGGEFDAVVASLRLNWRLWTIFQAELLAPDCPLPADLRNNVLSLAAFVDKRTMDILANPDLAAIQVLININRELAMGLYESVDNLPQRPEEAVPAPEGGTLGISI